jgi:hypothetical protein
LSKKARIVAVSVLIRKLWSFLDFFEGAQLCMLRKVLNVISGLGNEKLKEITLTN